MKQNEKKSLLARLGFAFTVLLCGSQAWGSCAGELFFKAPSDWNAAYVYLTQQSSKMTLLDNGYYYIDLSTAQQQAWGQDQMVFKIISSTTYPANFVSSSIWNGLDQYSIDNNTADIACPGPGQTLYAFENPASPGTAVVQNTPPNAKTLYFLPPDEPDWYSSSPMISFDGGKTGTSMIVDPDRCGWFYYSWFGEDTPSDNVTIFRDTDSDKGELIGYDGWTGAGVAPTPIPAATIFNMLGDNLFFISDESMWPAEANEANKGFFTEDPMVDGNCTYSLAAVIYDSDEELNDLFSSDPNVSGFGACTGVRPGIVKELLGDDNKPVFNAGNANATLCGGTEDKFNTLFNYTSGVNDVACYDMPFSRASDGRWAFDSDLEQTDTTVGGFYPFSDEHPKVVLESFQGVPVTDLGNRSAKLRKADGPVAVKSLPAAVTKKGITDLDQMCNTYGWTGGIDCSGLFASGSETNGVEWDWSIGPNQKPRWTGAMRNQQFCFESHAKFTYRKGQKFTFRGDDDIWVFIDGKIAVDNGGAHLAAPGYVDLSLLTGKSGPLQEGQDYNIDIFFCDRRTTMSNVVIKTNMYIQQSSGVSRVKDSTYTGTGDKMHICYTKTGNGDCASVAMGESASGTETYCDAAIEQAGYAVTYALYKGGSVYTSAAGVVYDASYFSGAVASGTTVFFGAVDLSDWYAPVVLSKNATGLPSGSYKLIAFVGTKSTTVTTLRVAGSLDVMTADGKDSTGHVYTVKKAAMADVRIPVYVGAIGDVSEGGYLDVDLETAVDESYTANFTDGLLVYTDSLSTTPITSADKQTVGPRGTDTLWVTVPLSAMTASTVTKEIYVRKAKLTLTFSVPAIAFVDSSYATQLKGYGNWEISSDSILYRGAEYKTYVMMYDPTTGTPCITCSYSLNLNPDPTATSAGITGSALPMTEGKAEVRIRSSKLYNTTDSAFFTVTTTDNALIAATFRGLQFIEPPVPIPDSVMVFDVKGAPKTYAGLDQAFTRDEYLDGIADSIWIRYHRPFKLDSLPDSIEVHWSVDSTETVTISRAQIEAAAVKLAPPLDTLYDSVLAFGGLELSSAVQTANVAGSVSNWASFKKNGTIAHQNFDKGISDRVAPVMIRGTISEMSEGLFQVRIVFSEPMKTDSVADVKSLFKYFLRSATDLVGAAKFTEVPATNATVADSNVTMFYNANNGVIPQSGDYVRAKAGGLTDAYGNGLTEYDVVIPSPWMLLEGDAQSTIASIKIGDVLPDVDLKADPIQSHFLGIYDSIGTLTEQYPNTIGYIIKTDMGNMLTDPKLDSLIAAGKISIDDVELHYQVDIFTNLGSFVVSKKETIACSDAFFGGDCRSNRGYVYVGWDMVTSKGRVAGTGAYIAKLSTHATIPTVGKKGKHNVTQTWGVRRTSGK